MMYRRILTESDVDYNTVILLPKLYRENKMDTIQAIIDYDIRSYSTSGLLAPFIIIDEIRTRRFRERLENSRTINDSSRYRKISDSLQAGRNEQGPTDTIAMQPTVGQRVAAARKAYVAAQSRVNDAQIAVVNAAPLQKSLREETLKKELASLKAAVTELNAATDARFYQDYIISYYLQWFLDNYDIKDSLDYPEFIRAPYSEYFDFIKTMATEQLKKPGLSPVEKFLLNFFANPSKQALNQLNDSEYNGSLLQEAWLDMSSRKASFQGFHVGFAAGEWIPQGNLSAIGNHPYCNFVIGGRGKNDKFMCDIAGGFRFGSSPNNYKVKVNDSAINTKSYIGYYAGLEETFAVWRNYRHEVDVFAGLAWEGYSTTPDTSVSYLSSVNFNVGVGYKLYVKHKQKKNNMVHSYIAFQAKYHFIHYANDGGTDLTGNALTVGLAYGWYSRSAVKHYYIDKW